MYRPAGIYLINLFPLGNWANTVHFMLKTSISRPDSGDSGSGDGRAKEKGRSATLPIQFNCVTKDGNSHAEQAPIRNKAPKLRHERSQIQGAGACWLQNSHEQHSKPGIRGH